MDDQQQREVAHGLRAGQAAAWRRFYDAFAEPLWRAVARWLGASSADVADVVQESFLAAARGATSYDPQRGTLWQWLWGIARRQTALHYRKQARHDRLRRAQDWLAANNGMLARRLSGQEPVPDDPLEARELAALVRSVLAALSDEYEMLLMAKYLDDASIEELAARTGSTSVAVRSKLARAREAFRKEWEAQVPPGFVRESSPGRRSHAPAS
jgi:RNA polymerase sigma-70 factor, ECF subfamily